MSLAELPRLEPLLCEVCKRDGSLFLDKRPRTAKVVCRRCLKKCVCPRCERYVSRLVLLQPHVRTVPTFNHVAVCLRCGR